ncbi:MAG: UvrD-helicase domain-containing protein [Pseudomonadota bacterium]
MDAAEAFLEPLRAELSAAKLPFSEAWSRPTSAAPRPHAALELLRLAQGPLLRDALVDVLRVPDLELKTLLGDAHSAAFIDVIARLPVRVDRTGRELLLALDSERRRCDPKRERELEAIRVAQLVLSGLLARFGRLCEPSTRRVFRERSRELFAELGLLTAARRALTQAIRYASAADHAPLAALGQNARAGRAIDLALERVVNAAELLRVSEERLSLSEFYEEFAVALASNRAEPRRGPRRDFAHRRSGGSRGSGLGSVDRVSRRVLHARLAKRELGQRARCRSGRSVARGTPAGDSQRAGRVHASGLGQRLVSRAAFGRDLGQARCAWRKRRKPAGHEPGPQRVPVEPASPLDPSARRVLALPTASAEVRARASLELRRQEFYADPDSALDFANGLAGSLERWVGGEADRPLALTQLERYARCGFLGFSGLVLRASQDDTVGDGLSARERGSLIHEALAVALTGTRQSYATRDLLELEREALARAEAFLRAQITSNLRGAALNAALEDVAALLRWSFANSDGIWFAEAERAFGSGQAWAALAVGSYFVSGRIDRIDSNSDGSAVRVIDYKTGTVRLSGEHGEQLLQPWIYARKVAEEYRAARVSSGYLSLQRRKPEWKAAVEDSDVVAGAGASAIQDKLLRAEHLIVALRGGRIPARPALPSSCTRCDARDICRRPLSAPPRGQRMSLPGLEQNAVIAASAGTGKTQLLTGIYLAFALGLSADGKQIATERIVATTFSARGSGRNPRAPRASPEPALETRDARQDSLAALAIARGLPEKELCARARRVLEELPRATIDTLHGLATSILRRHALELGLSPNFTILDEEQAFTDAERSIDDVLDRALTGELATASSRLLDACYGLDRARNEITVLLGRLDEEGLPADALATGDHVADAKRQLAALRAVCHSIAQAEASALSDPARAALSALAAEDFSALRSALVELSAVRASKSLKNLPFWPAFEQFQESLSGGTKRERLEALVEHAERAEQLDADARGASELLATIQRTVIERRRAEGTLGFGDVLRLARDGLRDQPSLAKSASQKTDVLLVDVFQDTSRVQRDLLLLLRERPSSIDRRKPGQVPAAQDILPRGLVVVGDRKQSIYAFRGAEVSVFAQLAAELAGAPAAEQLELQGVLPSSAPVAEFHTLTANYRSTRAIIEAVNCIARADFNERPERAFEIRYTPAEALVLPAGAEAAPSGTVTIVEDDGSAPEDPHLPALLRQAEGTLRSAFAAAGLCAKIARGGTRFSEIALLARRRATLPMLELALDRLNIPFVVAGRALYATPEVRDLFAALRLQIDPGDRHALAVLARGPLGGLSDRSLAELCTPRRGLDPVRDWSVERLSDPLEHDALNTLRERLLELGQVAPRLSPRDALSLIADRFQLEALYSLLPRGRTRFGNVPAPAGDRRAPRRKSTKLRSLARAPDRQRDRRSRSRGVLRRGRRGPAIDHPRQQGARLPDHDRAGHGLERTSEFGADRPPARRARNLTRDPPRDRRGQPGHAALASSQRGFAGPSARGAAAALVRRADARAQPPGDRAPRRQIARGLARCLDRGRQRAARRNRGRHPHRSAAAIQRASIQR